MNNVLFSQDVTMIDFIIRLVCLGWTIPFMILFIVYEIIRFVQKMITILKRKQSEI